MQDREPSTLENIRPGDAAGNQLPEPPAEPWDLPDSNHDAVLVLRESFVDRIGTIAAVAVAVVASFGLGWVGGLNWPGFASAPAAGPVAQKEAPPPHIAEARPSCKMEGARKAASAPDPVVTGSLPKTSARLPANAAAPAGTTPASVAAAARPQALGPAPETRPSTIPGWSVVEVRDGTAVLEGPEGIRMAARGDTVPGLGRVDSIVRWGNRWIVATASGLVATP
ncbi:hypothetical protein ACFFWD_13805 [Bradyrhizobium erythrophlei]|uniref:hypothetical protein n=1 Tax=Bradyrhizobium erythrophlei TaxID=1437360 RepID=UPI0035E90B6D